MSARLLGVVSLSLLCGCYGYTNKLMVGPATMRLNHGQLPSGARVVLEEARGTGTVSIALIVPSGAQDDPKGKEGLAHLVEHLSFRSKPAGKVSQSQAFDLLGVGYSNAGTSSSDTTFQVLAQAPLAVHAISLLAQQVVHPVDNIDPRVFEVERDVVQSELIERSETGFAGDTVAAIQKLLFPPEHPLSRAWHGTPQTVAALTLDDAQQWAKAHYRLNGVTMVVTGDFDSAQMLPQVLQALPDEWKAPGAPRSTPAPSNVPPEPPAAPEKLTVVRAALHRTELLLTWSLPPDWALPVPDEFIADTLEFALQPGPGQTIEDASRPVCRVLPDPESSMAICAVSLLTGLNPQKTLDALRDRVDMGWTRRLRIREFGAAETYIDQLFREENLVTRASERARGLHYTRDPFALTKRLDHIKHLEASQLSDVARTYLTPERMRALVLEPLTGAAQAQRSTGVGEDVLEVQVPASAVRTLAEGPTLAGLRRFSLDNGLQVLVVPRPAMPVVTVMLGLPGGMARGEQGAALVANWFSDDDELVTSQRTHPTHLSDVSTVRFQGGNDNIEVVLENVKVWLTRERSSQALENLQYRKDKRMETIDLDADEKAKSAFFEALYRGSRFNPALDVDIVKAANLDAGERWRRGAFQPAQSVLVITGDVDPARMRDLVTRHLGDWVSAGPALPLPPPAPLEAKKTVVQVNHRPKSAVVTLVLGCLLPPTEPAHALAPAVLASALQTRLNRVWRNELGVSYGVHTAVDENPVQPALYVESQLDPHRLTAVLRSLKQQWDQAELPEHDVAMARWDLARTRSTLGATSESLARYFAAPAVRTHDLLGAVEEYHQLAEIPTTVVQHALDVCKGTTVLRLDGERELIDPALHDANQ